MENMKQMIQELLGGMEERISADRKADRDELKAIMNALQEKMDSNHASLRSILILKWILERQDVMVWIGLIWLRIGTSGGHL
jgi:hypothetical protein